MSNAAVNTVSFVSVLSAAINKAEQPALVVAAVREAAEAFAKNGGAKGKIEHVRTVCTTTAAGKARTPAAGTMPALILSAMDAIMSGAAAAGARPAKDADMAQREAAAAAFADGIVSAFVAARDGAAAARKAAKAEKDVEKAAKAEKDVEKAAKAEKADRQRIETTTPPAVTTGAKETDRQRAARYLAELRSARHEAARLRVELAALREGMSAAAPAPRRRAA
jgi:hypothetical protein